MFESSKAKLMDLTRAKGKLSVTKWEMLLILQMNARDVKSICSFITGEDDPQVVDINTFFFLLVLTNKQFSLGEKIDCKWLRYLLIEV